MATGLIIVVVSKQKNKDITITELKTRLLATDRILDMADNSSGRAVFYYDHWASQDNKDVPSNFTCTNWSCGPLDHAIRMADRHNSRFWINVETETRITGGRVRTIDKMIKLFANQVVDGWNDKDGLHSHIIITRGSNFYRLKTTHTLLDLVRASSKSASLSASLLSGGSTGGREQ